MRTKINKISKIISLLSYLFMIIFFVMALIAKNNSNVADYVTFHIITKIYSIIFIITEHLPTLFLYLYLFFTPILILISYLLYTYSKRIDNIPSINKIKLTSLFFTVFSIYISFFIINISMGYIAPYTNNIDNFYLKEYKDKEYTIEDFNEYIIFIYNKVDKMSNQIPRDSNGIIKIDNINRLSVNNLKNIKEKYYFLHGLYPYSFKDISYQEVDSGFGFTSTYAYASSVLGDLNTINLLNTTTHELCHIKGINKESDAVFCTYEAGINSSNYVSNYAAYYEAFTRIYTILELSSSEHLEQYKNLITNKCLIDNYEEFCNYNYKELREKKYNANKILLSTYDFNINNEYNSKIINNLNTLNEQYTITIYDNNKKIINYNEALDIINNQKERIYIIIDMTNKEEKLLSYLKPNSRLYPIIKQIHNKDNIINFTNKNNNLDITRYLKPFEKRNYLTTEYNIEYSYSRAIRLLLEKYDYDKNH